MAPADGRDQCGTSKGLLHLTSSHCRVPTNPPLSFSRYLHPSLLSFLLPSSLFPPGGQQEKERPLPQEGATGAGSAGGADAADADANAESESSSADGRTGGQPRHNVSQISIYLKKLQELNTKKTYTIVVLGLEKAGKSTFINAILQGDILPSDEGRCTMVQCEVEPSTRNELEVTVFFRSRPDFEETLKSMPRKQGESADQFEERKAKIRRVCHDCVGSPTLQRVANSRDEECRTIEEMCDYFTSQDKMYAVRKVVIGTRRLGDATVRWRILDVPGWDSTIEEHRGIAMQAIDSADAFIVLSNATRPDLTEHQAQFLTKVREAHYGAMSKAFGVLTYALSALCSLLLSPHRWSYIYILSRVCCSNFFFFFFLGGVLFVVDSTHHAPRTTHTHRWLDTIDHVDNYKRVVGMAKEQLLQYGFVEQNIFPACAIAAFAEPPERMRGVVQNIERKLEEYPGLADGFHDCVAAVKHCVSRDLPIRRVKEAADLVGISHSNVSPFRTV